MNPTIFFSVCSLFYCALIMIVIFGKKEKKKKNLKYLKILSVIGLGNLLCEASGIFLGANYEKVKLLNDIVLRLMLILYVLWFGHFVIFTLSISEKNGIINKKYGKIIYTIISIFCLLVTFLPIIYHKNSQGVITYSTGLAVQVLYYYIMLCQMACLVIMFANVKKVKISNYTSLFILIILSTLAAAIQSYYPSILLTASAETFVLYVAYIKLINSSTVEKSEK